MKWDQVNNLINEQSMKIRTQNEASLFLLVLFNTHKIVIIIILTLHI
jgi:hypothetical protein